jgi:hypothetical protein
MVKVKCKQKNPDNLDEWIEKEIYLDGYCKSNLDLGIAQLHKNFDQVWFIDGPEGAGKTVLGVTYAYYVNEENTRHNVIDRICYNVEMADKIILEAKPFQAVVIDEAFGGMNSTGSNSKINKLLQRRFTEIRAKNLFIFIIAPSFMDIQRYFAIWRSRCLLHVYTNGDERGYCSFYNENKKKKLYIMGKKQFYNYGCVAPNFVFRFTNEMKRVIDEDEYNRRKARANLMVQTGEDETTQIQRKAFRMAVAKKMREVFNAKNAQIAKVFGCTNTTVGDYFREMSKSENANVRTPY